MSAPALLALLLLPPAAGARPVAPRNLIMISLGNVGARHMGLYGYARRTTPGLDRWARGAVVFDRAYSPASWTLPVAATVFTGLSPRSHGLMSRLTGNRLANDIPTLAERLSAAGWSTGAFAGGLDYDPVFGHMRGFSVMARNLNFERSRLTLAQAERWLSRAARAPYFVFIHGYDAHCPFVPSPGYQGAFTGNKVRDANGYFCARAYDESTGTIKVELIAEWCRGEPGCPTEIRELTPESEREMRALHDETVLEMDSRVTAFLDALPRAVKDEAVIVVYGDHGEMFAKNGRFGRLGPTRGTFYEDVIRVPLLIKAPGLAPRRVARPVEIGALLPTVLDLLGVSASSTSLRATWEDRVNEQPAAYSGLDFLKRDVSGRFSLGSEIDAVIEPRWKLIRERRPGADARIELYDLEADPEESRNLAETSPLEKARLEGLLEARRRAQSAPTSPPSDVRTPESIRRAARLYGYW